MAPRVMLSKAGTRHDSAESRGSSLYPVGKILWNTLRLQSPCISRPWLLIHSVRMELHMARAWLPCPWNLGWGWLERSQFVHVPSKDWNLRQTGFVHDQILPALSLNAVNSFNRQVSRIRTRMPLNMSYAIYGIRGTKPWPTHAALAVRKKELWGRVDADWAGDIDTRRPHTGYILLMNGGPISWKSADKMTFLFRLSNDMGLTRSAAASRGPPTNEMRSQTRQFTSCLFYSLTTRFGISFLRQTMF